MFRNLKITCDQATTICDKNQYSEALIKDKIKLYIHLLVCKICAKYSKQNTMLSSLYKGHSQYCNDLKHCLSLKYKEDLKALLEKTKNKKHLN
jgi:hypothetical protein